MNKTEKEAWTGGKNISPETSKKRKNINKKILKFGCLPIVILFGLFALIGSLASSSNKTDSNTSEFNDPLNIGVDSLQTLVGKTVPYNKWGKWGTPKTLDGTDGQYWVVYLDLANVSFISDKKTDKILFAGFEKNSATNYLNDIKITRKELLDKQFSQWDGSHIELTKLIKKAMNDPNSYEHEETVYSDMGSHLVVSTTYRGKNAFGGVVKNWVKVKTDIQTGNVLEIMEEGR